MRSVVSAWLLALGLLWAACGSGGASSTDPVCRHYVVVAEEYGLLLPADEHARCMKDQERSRRRLGDQAYAVHAACLLAARNLVEWMTCDPREGLRDRGGRGRDRP